MFVPFLLIVPGMLALCSISPLTAYFAGRKMLHVNLWASAIALMVTLIGDIAFIPHFKIIGAAFVSSLGYIVYTFVIMRYFIKESLSSYRDFFGFKKSDLNWFKNFPLQK